MILDFSPEAVEAYDKNLLEGTALGNKIDQSIKCEILQDRLRVDYYNDSINNLTE